MRKRHFLLKNSPIWLKFGPVMYFCVKPSILGKKSDFRHFDDVTSQKSVKNEQKAMVALNKDWQARKSYFNLKLGRIAP